MKSNTTALWFVLAVTLAAAIWLLENYFQPAATGEKPVFAGLRADHVTGIQIIPAGAREINGGFIIAVNFTLAATIKIVDKS